MKKYEQEAVFPRNVDVLVIGGGGVGSSIAFWLKKMARDGLNVAVVEKDPTYKNSSTGMSVGLTQQFSLPESIQMSLFGTEFIRNYRQHFDNNVDLRYTPFGHLTLATEKGAEQLIENSKLQNEMGARNEILIPEKIKSKFPWINTDGIALGCHGLEKEGWFDPFELLMGYKSKAMEFGAHYVDGEAYGFKFREQNDIVIVGGEDVKYKALDKVQIKMANGDLKEIKFAICVIAAGAESGNLGKLANIGNGSGILGLPIPVELRQRHMYSFSIEKTSPALAQPLTIDPSGTFFRRDGIGGQFIAGQLSNGNLPESDFETTIKPTLANRVPALNLPNYESNTYDDNGILGPHPLYHNLYIATGFSGFGIQQTPAIGKAISELIMDGQFRLFDYSRLGFDRFIVDQPIKEAVIV
uniref:FAD-dependent oxidoreductase domain-containing protein 1 n=1 Tax=Megaselia scalaris TaxID=36166 RepID=T1GPK0_MEGSC